jgi:PhzF family phenazine biosynthesis protein
MEQTAPLYQPQTGEEGAAIIASLGGLGADPVIVNTGNAFAVIRVDSQQQLRDLQPQVDSITAISERHGLIGYYVFTTAADAPYDATTRMFAPAYGIPEEPATGTAAGTLAGYVFRYDQAARSYLFQQGAFMASPAPSEIKAVLNTEGDKIQNIYVGGDATLIDTINIGM